MIPVKAKAGTCSIKCCCSCSLPLYCSLYGYLSWVRFSSSIFSLYRHNEESSYWPSATKKKRFCCDQPTNQYQEWCSAQCKAASLQWQQQEERPTRNSLHQRTTELPNQLTNQRHYFYFLVRKLVFIFSHARPTQPSSSHRRRALLAHLRTCTTTTVRIILLLLLLM